MFRSPCHPRNKWWSQEIIFPTAKTAQTWAEAQFTPKTYFWQQVCIISSSIITLPSVQFLRSISVVDKVFSIQGPKSNNLHCQHHHTIPCKTIVEKDTEGNCSTPGCQELRARFFKVFQRPSGIDDKTRNKKKLKTCLQRSSSPCPLSYESFWQKRSIEYEGKTAKIKNPKNLPAKLLITEPGWTGTVLDTGFKVTKALYVLAHIDNDSGDDDGDGDYKD